MRQRLRGPLVVVLVLALVATLGGMEALRRYEPERSSTASAGSDESFLGRLGRGARELVNGGPGRTRPEAVIAGLRLDQKPKPGVVKKPAKRVKELTGRRTATTRVFKMSDGRLQAEVSAAPRFYRDAKGAWQPIDTTVSASKAGGFAAANTTNTFTSRFGASTATLARFELDGQQVSLGLAGAARKVTPTVKGDTVTYAGILDGVDLSYEVTATSLKERMVLRSATAASSMTFTLDAGTLKVAQLKDGSIEFRSPQDNRVLLVMPAPFMFDSKADKSSPYGYAYSTKVTQALRAEGGRWAIDVAADKGWLSDPKRVWPVTVDPTIKIQPAKDEAQDAMVVSDGPSSNYGSTWNLSVGTTDLAAARSLVKFDLSDIPQNTVIESASLQMYYDTFHTSDAYDVPVEVREVTTPWDEATVNWTQVKDAMGAGAATVAMVDDTDTSQVAAKGSWPASGSTLTKNAVNQTYLVNNDAVLGDTYTWTPIVPEDGTYTVEAHYVPANDRNDMTVYNVIHDGGTGSKTINQKLPSNADWASLGTYSFKAGTAGRVVVTDANSGSTKAVIADAVRLTKSGGLVRAKEANVWSTFPATNLVQKWVNESGTNNGFMIKAVDEVRLGHGGPRYQAAENAYNGETENAPKLIINYGNPGVVVDTPRTLYPTGAALRWSAYAGSDLAEYQVHRSTTPNFTPSAATLVAPVKSATSYTDTTATPTPASSTDPYGQVYYYQVAVRTTGGALVPSTAVTAKLPKSGQVVQTIEPSADVVLSSNTAKQDTNLNTLGGKPQLMVGNYSTDYSYARSLLRFDTSSIPADAKVLSSSLNLWKTSSVFGTSQQSSYNVHVLSQSFDPAVATWKKATSTTNWTTVGGDYSATVAATLGQFGVDDPPQWRSWAVKDTVQGWITNPTTNKGFLIKHADEGGRLKEYSLFLSSEGTEAMRPRLQVVYTQPDAVQTYYAPTTPSVMTSGGTYSVPVTLSNPTNTTWLKSDWVLTYSWALPSGDPVPTAGTSLQTALPVDVVPIGSATGVSSVDVTAQVKAPAPNTDGNRRNNYTLKWELVKKDGTKLTGIGPLTQEIAVEEPTSDQLGLEKYYSYAGKNTGAGGTLMNNLYAGNTVWSYNAFSNPSRGVSTFVRLAYNSLDTSDSVAGYGWSLQASSMMRLGTPLDFHPNPNPTKVTFTDGDGTGHRFTWDPATSEWKSPKGVHLYLQKVTSLDCKPNTEEPKAWRLTKPDRTQFYYDCEGFLTSVVDNNGNEMVFTYEERRSNNKPTKFLRYITDPAGRITLTIDYYAKGQDYTYIDDIDWLPKSATNLTNPHIIDHVSQITDISGRKLAFAYTDKGLLGRMIDGAGSSGAMGAEKKFEFRYDMTQGNKNVKLVKVTDPRNNATDLKYYYPQAGDDPKWHWRTKSYDDRYTDERLTTFVYADPDATDSILTTVTDAENHATKYLMDGLGRPTETTNAKDQKARLEWDGDHNVTLLEEHNKAVSTWKYDEKTGYPTEIKDAEANANGTRGTVLAYQYQLNGYVADLIEKSSPEDRKWTFGYTAAGDLEWVVDPAGNSTTDENDYKTLYTYDAWGQMRTAKNARGFTTHYDDFDANGYPKIITDAKEKSTRFTYDERGQVKTVTDAYGKVTSQEYDLFGRPGENRVPKDQGAGDFIVTPAPEYDENDNVVKSFAPNGAFTIAQYDAVDQLEFTLAPVDEEGGPQRKTSFTYDKVGNLKTTTEPMGNLTPEVDGDYVTTNGYDEIYQLTSVTNAKGHKISYEYDNVGNVWKVVDPRKNASSVTDDYTMMYEYDKAHRVIKVTDALGKFTETRYDRDGVVKTTTDQLGNTTEIIPDPRGKPKQVKVPHKNDNGTITYRITEYRYDQVGNQTKVISPRGTATPDPDDFTTETVYDELDRVKETRTAYDGNDARYKTADVTTYEYDDVGRLATVSMPPSAGESVRNNTVYTYWDNGSTKTSRDPWDILTSYDYNKLGAQTERTLTPAGEDPEEGSSNRTMTWSYFPDGKLASRSDSGVPVGRHLVLVDNSDFNNTTATGTWTAATAAEDKYGHNYATRAAGTGANTFTWQLNVPQTATYEVFARYPTVSGAAVDAKYTVNHGGGDTVKTVNQTANTGTWVSLGSYSFTEGNSHKVSLSDQAGGTVVADAVKLVRDNSGEADDEKVDYTYRYDPNGNLKTITDSSPHARVDTYSIDYTNLNEVQTVTESKLATVKNTTSFTYNENSAPLTTTHEKQYTSYGYDERDLVSTVVNGKSATDPDRKTSTFTYTDRMEKLREVKGNGNTVDYTYYLDGLLNTQVEKKPNGTLVSEHTYTYDLNGNRKQDVAKKMNADDHSAYLNTTSDYTYDPRDRLVTLTKTGDGAGTETYIHDANNNVIEQTIKGTTTTFNYDRNRLLTASAGGVTSSYNYDPFGRVDTVTAAGTVIERNVYDGFDHVIENHKNNGTSTSTTKYTFDPLDRTATKTTDAGGAKEKTTTFNYLGLSSEVLDEEVAGKLTKSYQYSPWGQRLSQVTYKDDGTEENAYYGYDKHTDVEQLTDDTGDTKATYGYTAYGKNDDAQFTGIDKPDAADPTKEPYNAYRFNAKRWDQNSQSYDMGFRDYSPGLNRFLSRDSYNGALADMKLGINPWTGNRYAFCGGNPISGIELDGHIPLGPDDEAISSLAAHNDLPDVPVVDQLLKYSDAVQEIAAAAGVDPATVMALLIKESSLRTMGGGAARTYESGQVVLDKLGVWSALVGHGPSIGLCQMQEETFKKTADRYPEVFAGRSWNEMVYDDKLAITAMTYQVKMLQETAEQHQNNTVLTTDQLVAVGYNQGADSMVEMMSSGELNDDARNYVYGQDIRPGYSDFRSITEFAWGGWMNTFDPSWLIV